MVRQLAPLHPFTAISEYPKDTVTWRLRRGFVLVLSSRNRPFESQFAQTSNYLLSGNSSQSRQLPPSPGEEFLWSGRLWLE